MRTLCIALCLLAGCVAKGRHEIVTVQLDATRTALSARQAACQEEIAAVAQREVALRAELSAEQARVGELTDRLTHAEAELRDLRADQARWLQEGVEEGQEPPPADLLASALALSSAHRLEAARVERHHADVHAAFAPLVEAARVTVVHDREQAIVRIGANVLFQEGKVVLSPLGDSVLAQVAEALGTLPGRTLRIDGHTDDRPHHSARHESNWELGFDRAVLVLRALEERDVRLPISAASFAQTRPAVPHDAPDARKVNARIELVLTPAPAPEAPSPATAGEPGG